MQKRKAETFNLLERAEYGLNFLNCNVDKSRGCLPYFVTIFKNDPAEARHDWPDFGDLTARYVEAFVMARKMLGIKDVGDVELSLRNLLLSYFNEKDGLSYRPKPERPYYSTILRENYDKHVAEGFDQARVLWGLLAWYEESKDPVVWQKLEELIKGLDRVLVKKENYGYYDRGTFSPGDTIDPDAAPMPHQFYFCGTQIHPLVECYRVLGIQKAFDLAVRLCNYIVYHSDYFSKSGVWNCKSGDDHWASTLDGHTHSRFATIAGIAQVGIVFKDSRLTEFAKCSYDWFVSKHGSRIGWSPEFIGRFGDADEGCETCALMDQINCCLAFCQAGYTEYYEQIEKITRNQLMESQLLDTSIVRNTVEKPDTELSCFHNVAEMVRGGFAGWAGPNDFIGNCDHHYCLMNCCGPAGIRAFYDVWSNIATVRGDDVYVNIFMDKRDDAVDISHRQPYEGKLTIVMKRDCRLYLANRSWFNADKVKIFNGDHRISCLFERDYILVGKVVAGDRITVEYPLDIKTEAMYVNGRSYIVTWKGDTVVKMMPPGCVMPFYTNRE